MEPSQRDPNPNPSKKLTVRRSTDVDKGVATFLIKYSGREIQVDEQVFQKLRLGTSPVGNSVHLTVHKAAVSSFETFIECLKVRPETLDDLPDEVTVETAFELYFLGRKYEAQPPSKVCELALDFCQDEISVENYGEICANYIKFKTWGPCEKHDLNFVREIVTDTICPLLLYVEEFDIKHLQETVDYDLLLAISEWLSDFDFDSEDEICIELKQHHADLETKRGGMLMWAENSDMAAVEAVEAEINETLKKWTDQKSMLKRVYRGHYADLVAYYFELQQYSGVDAAEFENLTSTERMFTDLDLYAAVRSSSFLLTANTSASAVDQFRDRFDEWLYGLPSRQEMMSVKNGLYLRVNQKLLTEEQLPYSCRDDDE